MTDRETVLRLQAQFNEAERQRPHSAAKRLLIWAGCFAVNMGLWAIVIYGAARAIDLAKGY